MTSKVQILVLLAVAINLQACEAPIFQTDSKTPGKTAQRNFELGQEFELNFDAEAKNVSNSITVKFMDVEEGRCPNDVMCAWAGNASIDVLMIVNSEYHEVTLNTHDNLEKSAHFSGYSVRLIGLSPYPESSENPVPAKKYKATLIVESVGS